jgi:hypothetical protein
MSADKKSANKVQEKQNIIFEYALLFIFAVFVILLSTTKLNGEDDLYWHMATGKFILANKYVPDTDVFGFVTSGMPWIPFEWLWDITAYLIFGFGNFTGLYIFTYILVILIFYLLYSVLKKFRINTAAAVLFLFVVALGIKYRIGIKPQMFTYLFFVLVLKLIADYKYFSANIKRLYFIPAIFLIWANVHMGVIAGILLWGIFFVSELWTFKNKNKINPDNFSVPTTKSLYTESIVTVLSVIAMMINPSNIKTYLYSFSHTQMKMIDYIYEWFSPFHPNYSGKLFIIVYIIFLLGFISVLYYSVKRKDYFSLILVPVFIIYSIRAVRFTTDYILISAIFIVVSLNFILTVKNYSFNFTKYNKPLIYITGLVLLVSIIITPDNKIFRIIGFNSAFGTGLYEETYPVNMYNFIRENKIAEIGKRPFQTLDNGGFFIWNFSGSKNFIDSRNLNDSIYFTQIKIRDKKPGYIDAIRAYKFDYFMIFNPIMITNNKSLESSVISYLCSGNEEWSTVYWDDKSLLSVKNNEEFKDIVSKFGYKYFTPYNLYYRKDVIEKALKEDKETLMKELQRRQNEEPNSFYINNFMQIYGKQIN